MGRGDYYYKGHMDKIKGEGGGGGGRGFQLGCGGRMRGAGEKRHTTKKKKSHTTVIE